MSADYLAIAATLARNNAACAASVRSAVSTVSVSFDSFTVEANYHLEGWHRAGTEDSAPERPVPYVDECRLMCGSWRQIVPFELLSADVQEQVLDMIEQEEA